MTKENEKVLVSPSYFRDPGMIERFYICCQVHKLYSNYAISVQYNQPVTKEILSNALREVVQANSVFVLGFKNYAPDTKSCKKYKVGPVPKLLFEDVVEFIDRPFCEQEFQFLNQRMCPVSDTLPSWRIVVFNNNYLSFYNNHAFFDGESGIHFHEDICQAFDKLSGFKLSFVDVLYDVTVDGFKHHLPVSELTTICDTTFSFFLKRALQEFLPARLVRFYNYLTSEGYPHFTQSFFMSDHHKSMNTNFKFMKLSQETVKQLADICRRNGFTITAFLDVMLGYCFQNTILPWKSNTRLAFESSIVMSGRRYFPQLANQTRYNYLVTGKDITLTPIDDMDSLVKKMKLVKQFIDKELKEKTSYQLFGLLEYISPYSILNPKDSKVKSPTLFELSNLGYKNISCGKWMADDIMFTQCLGTIFASGFSIVSTKDGMNIVFGYPDDFTNAPIEEFAAFFSNIVQQFIIELK